jgi:hypothetical protein
MSTAQNLAYSIIQVAHNFGAAAAVGGTFAGIKLKDAGVRKKLAWLAAAGLAVQGASGAAFGAVSHYFYHAFPDISGIALTALGIKMACAAAGFFALTAMLVARTNWSPTLTDRVWTATFALTATALAAAAVLRWFA